MLRIDPMLAIACLVPSIENCPGLRAEDKAFVKLKVTTETGATLTVNIAELFALYESNICAMVDKAGLGESCELIRDCSLRDFSTRTVPSVAR